MMQSSAIPINGGCRGIRRAGICSMVTLLDLHVQLGFAYNCGHSWQISAGTGLCLLRSTPLCKRRIPQWRGEYHLLQGQADRL